MTRRKSAPKKQQVESYFDAERILDEKKEDGKWYYLIKWLGHDKNGNPWPSSWEPKENCTPLLLIDWEKEKNNINNQDTEEEQSYEKEQEEPNQEIEILVEAAPQNDVQDLDDKPDNEVMNIDKTDDKINEVDDKINFNQLNQVLDKYCHINTSQSSEPKKDANNFHKIKFSPKVKLVKISPIQPIIASNTPIKSNILIVEHNDNESLSSVFNNSKFLMNGYHSANKVINGKKYSLPSQSGRLSLFNLNKRGPDHVQDSNDNSTTKKQKTEIVPVPETNNIISNVEPPVLQTTICNDGNDKKDTSQPDESATQSNKVLPSGNSLNSHSVPTSSTHSGAIHVNSETIKQAYSRINNKNASSSGSANSTSSSLSKFRPIAAKIAPAPSQFTISGVAPNVGKVNSSSSVGKLASSSTSTYKQNLPLANRLASIRTPVPVDNFPKSNVSTTSAQIQSDKRHTSYFHKSFVQNSSSNDEATQSNQSTDSQPSQKVSTPNKQPTANEKSSSNSQNNGKTDLWMNEWAKAKEVHHLRLEVERRPQSESESSEVIKKYHESIQKLYSKWLETQNKFVTKSKEFTNLETELTKLQSEYTQIKKLVMGKHTEGESLKDDLKKSAQELNKLRDENKNLKADWSCLMRDGAIMMREDYCKITKLQNSLQDLIQQRSNVNEEINRLRKETKQEVNKMRESNRDHEILRMAEENSTIAENTAKLMLEIKKRSVGDILKKHDTTHQSLSFSNVNNGNVQTTSSLTFFSNSPSIVTTLQRLSFQHRDNPKKLVNPEKRVHQNNFAQGASSTNVVQARNVPLITKSVRNLHFSKLAEKPNASANAKVQLPPHLRLVQGKRSLGGPLITSAAITSVPSRRLNLHYPILTDTKTKVTANPIPHYPTKSTQQMNYLCEWNLCKKLFSKKSELKNHLKDHLNSGKIPIGKDKNIDGTDDLVAVKVEF
ncbi:6897_t:CDS:2 [Funneliformis caledonium]|uniref:6897_t:CDS:1 n=1 Tax=Funneliformis caledonium TaxID=1117310 RepID=A0A9N8ZQU9_9GLOM|nr:6897_t:CDS:2 [Funneliformis caledonium]